MVFAKFDKDQYPLLLKQFDALKQNDSVLDYQRCFEELAHGILLYNPSSDDTYLVTQFLGGLKEEIRVAITLHRPKDVDTASALAQLQEEELENSKKKSSPKEASKPAFKPYIAADKARQAEPEKAKGKVTEDKLGSLKAYRRQHGLCFRCGEKWGPGHKCPTQVPIHVVEELLDALEDGEETEMSTMEDSVEPEAVMAIGDSPVKLKDKRKTEVEWIHWQYGSLDTC